MPQTAEANLTTEEGAVHPALVFRRRAGNAVRYECQRSTNLVEWLGGDEVTSWVQIQPEYDGTGTSIAVCASLTPFSPQTSTYFRVQVKR